MPKQMSRRQVRAAKERERREAERIQEEARLVANYQRLKKMSAGFSIKTVVASTSGHHDPRVVVPFRRSTPKYPSATDVVVLLPATKPLPLSPEMQEREAAAQIEIKKKRQRVAPLYNKGGLQFVSDGMDLTTIGRKV